MPAQMVSTLASHTTVNGHQGDLPTIHKPALLELPSGKNVKVPAYTELPSVAGLPHGCTWGLWDSLLGLNEPDELGTLNLLTPSTVLTAKSEVQHGISVAINWSLNNCQTPHSNRRPPSHKVMKLRDAQGEDCPWTGHDDEVHMNTQSGSQWDGFRKSFASLRVFACVSKCRVWHKNC